MITENTFHNIHPLDLVFFVSHEFNRDYTSFKIDNGEWYIIGDLIIPRAFDGRKKEYFESVFSSFSIEKLQQLKGIFYLIQINIKNKCLKVYNSLFSILPVYYFLSKDFLYISSRIDLIRKFGEEKFEISKKYILEKTLFNYALFNETPFDGIKLLASNHYLSFDHKLEIVRHTNILDYYTDHPISAKKAIDYISDLFIELTADYFPKEHFYMSLTGGLDGRTLIALALNLNKRFTTYSFGSEIEKDVIIPRKITSKLGIYHHPLILDEHFAKYEFFDSGTKALHITECNLNFSRAHYNYMAKQLSKNTNYIVTGIFGSEVIRTMHMAGNLIAQATFDIFEQDSNEDLLLKLRKNCRLKYLRIGTFNHEFEQLIEEILEYKKAFLSELNKNKKFYLYIFEEVFRKFFGPEIVLEQKYLFNRTPYLNFEFIKDLLQTELAGANATFKENNPLERYKGQMLYPYIIRKTYPKLLNYRLDRGYKPRDFLHSYGKINIIEAYYYRKIFDRKRDKPPYFTNQCFTLNLDLFRKINLDSGLCNVNYIINDVFNHGYWKKDLINFSNMMSLTKYLNLIKY